MESNLQTTCHFFTGDIRMKKKTKFLTVTWSTIYSACSRIAVFILHLSLICKLIFYAGILLILLFTWRVLTVMYISYKIFTQHSIYYENFMLKKLLKTSIKFFNFLIFHWETRIEGWIIFKPTMRKCNWATNRTWDLPITRGPLYPLSYLDTINWQGHSHITRVGLFSLIFQVCCLQNGMKGQNA